MNKKELKEILARHQLWLDSDGEEGRRALLGEVDLSGADLSGANLSGVLIHGADLSGADLRGSDLTGAAFVMTNLTGAKLGPEIRECMSFARARVSEDQLAWLCLHPRFSKWVSGLEIVN